MLNITKKNPYLSPQKSIVHVVQTIKSLLLTKSQCTIQYHPLYSPLGTFANYCSHRTATYYFLIYLLCFLFSPSLVATFWLPCPDMFYLSIFYILSSQYLKQLLNLNKVEIRRGNYLMWTSGPHMLPYTHASLCAHDNIRT